MITKKKKELMVQELKGKIEKSQGIFLTNIVGLSAENTLKLRKELRSVGASISVCRNTLFARASQGTSVESLMTSLEGAHALAFAQQDSSAVAKILFNFKKDFDFIKFDKAYVDGAVLESKQLQVLATLPSKNELIATLLATMNAPISALARVLHAVAEKKQGE